MSALPSALILKFSAQLPDFGDGSEFDCPSNSSLAGLSSGLSPLKILFLPPEGLPKPDGHLPTARGLMSYQGTWQDVTATPAARIRRPPTAPAGPSNGVLRALARLLAHRLDITDDDLVADLCCGSGRFTRAFAREACLRTPLVAVDARAALLAEVSSEEVEIHTSLMDPLDFAQFPAFYDCIVMKDAFDEIRDPVALFSTLRERLAFGGRLAVVQSRADSHAGPLMTVLRSRGVEEIDSAEVAGLQQRAGFAAMRSMVQVKEAIPWATYLQRVGARCLPILHYLKDAELMLGIDAMRSLHGPEERIEITHRFDIVIGLCR